LIFAITFNYTLLRTKIIKNGITCGYFPHVALEIGITCRIFPQVAGKMAILVL
jgi:hypothetical protein